jgi:hypothetical protein
MRSHLQTRALTEALRAVDATLQSRGTRLQPSADRDELERAFAGKASSTFFQGWAFDAGAFDEVVSAVAAVSPALARQLTRPALPGEFTVISACSMDLRFVPCVNGARRVAITLDDGRRIEGAYVKSFETEVYENGLIALETEAGLQAFFHRPAAPGERSAADLAHEAFAGRGSVVSTGLVLCFPRARTTGLVDASWVLDLESECGQYRVKQLLGEGEALIDEHGFFARETTVVRVEPFCEIASPTKVIIDGPFLVFLADGSGLQAAAWFDRDSFSPASAGLDDATKPEPVELDIATLFDE